MMYYMKVPLKYLRNEPDTDDVNRFQRRCAMLLETVAKRGLIESWSVGTDVSENAEIVDETGAVVMRAKEALGRAS